MCMAEEGHNVQPTNSLFRLENPHVLALSFADLNGYTPTVPWAVFLPVLVLSPAAQPSTSAFYNPAQEAE